MIEYIIISGVLGLVSGCAFYRFALFQIAKRTTDESKINMSKKPYIMPVWMLISGLLFSLVCWKFSDSYIRVEYILYISIALNIGFVDYIVRKIPNELLASLLLIRLIFIILDIAGGAEVKSVLVPSVLGFAIGAVLFIIPSFFAIPIGAGDVKYCAAIGFCLGISGFLQAMIIMALALVVYLIFLMVTKKGNMKTASAMGPYLSFGVIVTLLFPILGQIFKF